MEIPVQIIGHGHSSKPSDGLRMHFPHYDYDDMVAAQHELLTQGKDSPLIPEILITNSRELQNRKLDGGEGGIRTILSPLVSVSYR
jgi:hypothetical protein